jgi:hypothetical protein
MNYNEKMLYFISTCKTFKTLKLNRSVKLLMLHYSAKKKYSVKPRTLTIRLIHLVETKNTDSLSLWLAITKSNYGVLHANWLGQDKDREKEYSACSLKWATRERIAPLICDSISCAASFGLSLSRASSAISVTLCFSLSLSDYGVARGEGFVTVYQLI